MCCLYSFRFWRQWVLWCYIYGQNLLHDDESNGEMIIIIYYLYCYTQNYIILYNIYILFCECEFRTMQYDSNIMLSSGLPR